MSLDRPSIFISYCHEDEKRNKARSELVRHLKLLENQNEATIWYDKKLLAGEELTNIQAHLTSSDIVCVLLSSYFVASQSCMEELNQAVAMNKQMVPIILSACPWKDISCIQKRKVIPYDGRPISSFNNHEDAWKEVYDAVKDVVTTMKWKPNHSLTLKDEFKTFLNETGLLSKTCPHKEVLTLHDIFVSPDIEEFSNEKEETIKYSSLRLYDLVNAKKNILLAGDSQSGKSSLLKMLYLKLQQQGLVPIWISAKNNEMSGPIDRRLEELFHQQYQEDIAFSSINQEDVIPLIDDFHSYLGKQKKEKIVKELQKYGCSILTVDEIFRLNFKDVSQLMTYTQVRIRPLKPSKKVELITKWIDLDPNISTENSRLQRIDQARELVNNTLGREFRNGIMPSYPFFVLSILGAFYTGQPLKDITSQGYCYFFIILINLNQQGVTGKFIDTYLNFLTHLSFAYFQNNKSILHEEEFLKFVQEYCANYNLSENIETIKKVLSKSHILSQDSTGGYYFKFRYIYYYFVAKFLAENFDKQRNLISNLIQNLHRDDYAYILIFLTHHLKDKKLFEEILLNSRDLFSSQKAATLTKSELKLFDEKLEDMQLKFPNSYTSPEENRKKQLLLEDKHSEISTSATSDSEDAFSKEFRRSLKTIEVIGQIIKNRAGSLDKKTLNALLESGVNICLRMLSSYFSIIKDEKNEESFIQFLLSKLKDDSQKNVEEQKKMAEKLFWTFNFILIYAMLSTAIVYLGSDQLIPNIIEVNQRINTPATLLIKHGMLLRYKQDLDLDEIKKIIEKGEWHYISQKIMNLMVMEYFLTYHVAEKRKQIEHLFNMPTNHLLVQKAKNVE